MKNLDFYGLDYQNWIENNVQINQKAKSQNPMFVTQPTFGLLHSHILFGFR